MSCSAPLLPKKFATPDFSDYEEDDPEDFAILNTYADFLLSIESAILEIKSGGDHRFYGDIHIGGGLYGKAFTVYHRTADEAETVSPGSEADLTLCGPRYSLYARAPEFLYVDLHEEAEGPLLQKRVPYDRLIVRSNKPFQISATAGDCVLTVHMTAFVPSVVTRTELSLLNAPAFVSVSGTVSAVQTSIDEIKGTVPLFRRPDSDPIRLVGPTPAIPLDRHVAVTPIHIDDELVQEAYDLTEAEGVPPPFQPMDPVHGKGSSLVIQVDLKVVAERDTSCVLLRGAPKFELKGSHMVGRSYNGHVAGAPKRRAQAKSAGDGGEKHLCTGSPGIDPRRVEEIEYVSQELAIKVTVTSFLNYSCGNLNDELYEENLPLYQPWEDNSVEEEQQMDVI